jgi:hypothetical protein
MMPAFRRMTLSGLCIVGTVIVLNLAVRSETQQRVPFVGCPADGQADHFEPPTGLPKEVTFDGLAPGQISYYKGDLAPGAFAPAGWSCHSWYGSNGGTLLITPEMPGSRSGSVWPETSGPAVELELSDSGASGRFEVAKYGRLFFPTTAAPFIDSWKALFPEILSEESLRPFRKDSITVLSGVLAEFHTAPNVDGLGTDGFLRASSDKIDGIAFLDKSQWNFVTLRVRLSEKTPAALRTAILQLNKECIEKALGCSSR